MPFQAPYGSSDTGAGASVACCAPHPLHARAAAITTSFSLVAAAGTTLSAWCVMSVPQFGHGTFFEIAAASSSIVTCSRPYRTTLDIQINSRMKRSDPPTTVPQHLGHPDQFSDEAVRTPHERIVQQPAVLRKDFPHLANVDVPEDRDEAQLTHDRQQALNDPDPRERTCRHADESDGFVDVFVEAAIEGMLQESGKTMVVLGRDNDQTISSPDRLRVGRLFDRFARIVHGKR